MDRSCASDSTICEESSMSIATGKLMGRFCMAATASCASAAASASFIA